MRQAIASNSKNPVPGPGAYSSSSLIGTDGHSKTMSPKTVNMEEMRRLKFQSPGPGAYDNHKNLSVTLKTNPSAKIGTSQRSEVGKSTKSVVPGPNNY